MLYTLSLFVYHIAALACWRNFSLTRVPCVAVSEPAAAWCVIVDYGRDTNGRSSLSKHIKPYSAEACMQTQHQHLHNYLTVAQYPWTSKQ